MKDHSSESSENCKDSHRKSTWMLKSQVIIRGSLHKRMGSRGDENCSRKVEIETGWFLQYGGLYIKITQKKNSEEENVQYENSKDDTSPDALHFSVKESRADLACADLARSSSW